MKHRLLTFDYVFWYAIIFCQVVACLVVIKRKEFFKNWKVFSYYLFYMAGASIFTIAAFNFGSREMYVITYSVFDFIEAILINLVLLEILVKVLDPFESLPRTHRSPILFLGGAGNFRRRCSFCIGSFRTSGPPGCSPAYH